MIKIAIYPGTFDPITNGHVDIINRALALFDKVIVGVAKSERKAPCIALAERLRLIQAVFLGKKNIEVLELTGLTVSFAKQYGAKFLIRGLRSPGDFDYEAQIAAMNSILDPDIESVFLAAKPTHSVVSSTIVREIIQLGGDISNFVPEEVVTYFKEKSWH